MSHQLTAVDEGPMPGGVEGELIEIARATAADLDGPAESWMLRPALNFEAHVEHMVERTEGDVRLCISFLNFFIRDVMENLAGDVPYDILGERLDRARSNIQRALRVTLRTLADDLARGGDLDRTRDSCSELARQYAAAISYLNEQGGT